MATAATSTGEHAGAGAGTDWSAIQGSSDFVELRRRQRRFAFPLTAFFLLWYLAYVLLAGFAPAFMGTKVLGNITVGLILGLLQFGTTFVITLAYVVFAARRLDPIAEAIRSKGREST